MTSPNVAPSRSFWAWPGPAYLYEIVLLAAVYLPLLHFFNKSGFAMSVIVAFTICVTYVVATLRTDLSAKDWGTFNHYTVSVMRLIALGVGYWLFFNAPTRIVRYSAVIVYAVLYIFCENAAWRRKRIIEAADQSASANSSTPQQ